MNRGSVQTWILAFVIALLPFDAMAQGFANRPEVAQFIEQMTSRHGFSRAELLTLFTRARPQPGVIKPEMRDTERVNVYADNWFMLYINGKPVSVDSIDLLPHNVVSVDILPEYPMTIAVLAKDNADPKTGLEYGNHIGDAGFIIKFADGTVSTAAWKAKIGRAHV